MSSWEMFVARFPPEHQAAVATLLTVIRATLAVDHVHELAALRPDDITRVLLAIVPDNPFTDLDDRGRDELARRMIDVAGSLATGDQRSTQRRSPRVPEPARPAQKKPEPHVPPTAPPACIVGGQVRNGKGEGIAGCRVRAFDKNLRRETLLDEADTDAAGRYEIRYDAARLEHAKTAPDLIVRVFRSAKDARPAVESALVVKAAPVQRVDLVLHDQRAPLSDYERVLDAIAPFLDGVAPAALVEDDQRKDLTFLAGKAGVDAARVRQLRDAHRLAAETGLPPEAAFAFVTPGVEPDAATLVDRSPASLRFALEAAIAAGRVPSAANVDAVLDRVEGLKATRLIEGAEGAGLKTLLEVSGLSANEQQLTARAVLRHGKGTPAFWTALGESKAIAPGRLDALRLTLEIETIAGGDSDLVATLRRDRRVASAADLVKLDLADWTSLVKDGDPTAATRLMHAAEDAFPMAAMAARADADVRTFLSGNPDFAFGSTHLADFLQREANFHGVDRTRVTPKLRVLDRLYKVSRRASETSALSRAGLTSARAIAEVGRQTFVERYGAALGRERALTVHRNARRVVSNAVILFGRYGQGSIDLTPTAMPGRVVPRDGEIADWPRLFGSHALCACRHCRSLYGPAAYLVDLLGFLERWPIEGGITAHDGLLQRRPDVGDLELSCPNTNTLVPTVDLIIELLEDAVTRHPRQLQSTGTSEELIAQPEHVDPHAYDPLRAAHYPWTLPLDAWGDEARVYLGHLQAPRAELMAAFFKGSPEDALRDVTVAAERLRLSADEVEIITGRGGDRRWEAWGLRENPNSIADPFTSGLPPVTGRWHVVLKRVSVLLHRSGLRYTELLELLQMQFIAAGKPPADCLTSIDPADPETCDPSKLEVTVLDGNMADRIHRFVRLWRRLGWPMRDLDRAITALRPTGTNGQPDLTPVFIVQLSHIARLHQSLGLPVVQLLAWWGTLDVQAYRDYLSEDAPPLPSLYEERFRNKALRNPVDPAFTPGAAGLDATARLEDHVPAIAAALRVAPTDVLSLIGETNGRLSLASLGTLFAHASAARASGLSISEMITAKSLLLSNPFTGTPAALQFLEQLRKVTEAGFTIPEVDYLLRHRSTGSRASSNTMIAAVLAQLQAGLRELVESGDVVPEAPALVAAARAFLANDADLAQALALVESDGPFTAADEQFVTRALAFLGNADQIARLLVGTAPQYSPAIPPAEKERRRAVVLAPLEVQIRIRSMLSQKLATAFTLDQLMVERLLLDIQAAGRPALLALFDLPLSGEIAATDVAHEALVVLLKAGTIISKLKIDTAEYAWLRGHQGWLQIATLPASAAAPPASFYFFLNLLDYVRLRNEMAPDGERLRTVFDVAVGSQMLTDAADKDRVLEALVAITGWERGELEAMVGTANELVNAGMLGLKFPGDFTYAEPLLRTRDCFRWLARLGVSAKQIPAWTRARLDEGAARSTRETARARTASAAWVEAAPGLCDTLRERRRGALVDFLVARDGLRGPEELSASLLTDVETAPGQKTTRVSFAIAAVQRFVQRGLLHLEQGIAGWPDGEPSELAAEWRWMKHYRVWEANRKVFLYPENWIEPELRDDKTPLFTELENELLQNEMTGDAVETAFSNYLEKLDRIGHMQVCGIYHEDPLAVPREKRDLTQPSVLHVVARTRGIPNLYYYRRLRFGGSWTPWEKIDLDIEGDQVIPIAFNRRLYLFWPTFMEKSEMPFADMPQMANQLLTLLLGRSIGVWKGISGVAGGFANAARGVNNTFGTSFSTWPIAVSLPQVTLVEPVFELTQPGMTWIPPALTADPPNVAYSSPSLSFTAPGLSVTQEPSISADGLPSLTLSPEYVQALQEIRSSLDIAGSALSTGFEAFWATENAYAQGLLQLAMNMVPAKRPQIQLAWSELKNGKWGSRKLSDQSVGFVDVGGSVLNKKRAFAFSGVSNGGLEISCFVKLPMARMIDDRVAMTDLPSMDLYYQPRYLGSFELACDRSLDAYTAPRPSSMAQLYRLASDAVGDFMEAALPEMRRFVAGEAISIEDDDDSDFRRNTVTSMVKPQRGFRLLTPHQYMETLASMTPPPPFFYQDDVRRYDDGAKADNGKGDKKKDDAPEATRPRNARLFFVVSRFVQEKAGYEFGKEKPRSWFQPFYHPFVCEFMRDIDAGGVSALFDRSVQRQLTPGTWFKGQYRPTELVAEPYPVEDVDFSTGGAYAQYNWELFFHAPLLIADRLSKNQRFAEAQAWLHYIFDPTDASASPSPQRFWRTRPFFEGAAAAGQDIPALLAALRDPQATPQRKAVEAQLIEWHHHPFAPHALARLRLSAYQKTVVMKYIDNLIAWGDNLFEEDTAESINEAAQLYVLAGHILGRRPEDVPPRHDLKAASYNTLRAANRGNDALIDVEDFVPGSGEDAGPFDPADSDGSWASIALSPSLASLLDGRPYFAVPPNDKLFSYWTTVADRLFKIRHSMNIEGVTRDVAPFAPPIDPALLVRAAAAGIDLQSVLNEVHAPLPPYRFATLSQKATELCNDVKALGAALLGALEKRDGESLSLLRSTHELRVLESVREVRASQVADARANREALVRSRGMAEERLLYYSLILPVNPAEAAQLALTVQSAVLQATAGMIELGAAAMKLTPDFSGFCAGNINAVNVGGSPGAEATYGGTQIAGGMELSARAINTTASMMGAAAGLAGTIGSYMRRWDDWKLQERLALREVAQVRQQIVAADIRVAIAERELANHNLQTNNARTVDAEMRSKFTNQELFEWQAGQLSSLYFQSYRLAYDMCRRAERAYRYELGVDDSQFIRFGHWDTLKRGLLAGEALLHELKRMESAYLTRNVRELELTRHVSLATLDPLALVRLKQTGTCDVDVPEWIFDLTNPGDYMRRIKTVTVSIPCVTGPYTGVSCVLTLIRSSVRKNATLLTGDRYRRLPPDEDDPRFADLPGAPMPITTSTAQNDAGLFEVNLRDERYLPFEGAGAISAWRLELPDEFRQFDYQTIADVILQLRYTARRSPAAVPAVVANLRTIFSAPVDAGAAAPLQRLFSLKHEFSSEWYRFMHPAEGESGHTVTLGLGHDRFPAALRDPALRITSVDVLVKFAGKDAYEAYANGDPLALYLVPPGELPDPVPADDRWTTAMLACRLIVPAAPDLKLAVGTAEYATGDGRSVGEWVLKITDADLRNLGGLVETPAAATPRRLRAECIEDVVIICHYRLPSTP